MIWLVLAFTFLLSLPAHAAICTHYVSPGGHSDTPSDGNPGTVITAPWATIQKAASTAVAGNVVCIRGGTFNFTTTYPAVANSGTAGNLITFQAYQTEVPVLNFRGYTTTWSGAGSFSISGSDAIPKGYIVFDGLEVKNAQFGFFVDKAHHVTWTRVNFHDNGDGIQGGCSFCTVDRSQVWHNGWGGGIPNGADHGLYWGQKNITITNTLFFDNGGSNIQMDCISNTTGLLLTEGGCANLLIANNTIAYSNNGPGIYIWEGGTTTAALNQGIVIENNIFYQMCQQSSTFDCIDVYFRSMPSGLGAIIRNNIHFNTLTINAGNFFLCSNLPSPQNCNNSGSGYWVGGVNGQNNLIGTNPFFSNAPLLRTTTPNFHLTASSSLNTGLNLTACGTATDYDGVARPAGAGTCASPTGSAWEIGAYEFGAPPDVTPPAAPTGIQVQ